MNKKKATVPDPVPDPVPVPVATMPDRNAEDNELSGCSTCCSCSDCCDTCSEASDSSKKVRWKNPKGILKNAGKVENGEHRCCAVCTFKVHCNEKHFTGKNGKICGNSKKCTPSDGKKGSKKKKNTSSNSPNQSRQNWTPTNKANDNYSSSPPSNPNNIQVHRVELPQTPPQTPEERRSAQNLASYLSRNMSRLILPSRAEVIIREDVLENPSDPRPNAFFDARTGMLRVYHGPLYGNPGGSLVPLQAQHVPIGTPAPPTNAYSNPWAGLMAGMGGMWPFGLSQRGGDGAYGMPLKNEQNGNYSGYVTMTGGGELGSNSGQRSNNFNSKPNFSNGGNNNSYSRGKSEANDKDDNGSSDDAGGSNSMPGAFNNDDDNTNDNTTASRWKDSTDTTKNDTWSGDDGGGWEPRGDTSKANANNTSTDDAWGDSNDTSNNNTSSHQDCAATNNTSQSRNSTWEQSANISGDSGWNSESVHRRYNPATDTVLSAGSWGEGTPRGPTAALRGNSGGGGDGGGWGPSDTKADWGDRKAAQSTQQQNSAQDGGW